MDEILLADLSLPAHAEAVVWLLNEYAQDEAGGGAELSAYVKANLVAELRKRAGVRVILAMVDGSAAGLAVCMEGFSTFACQPLLNIHDIVVATPYRGRGLARRMLAKAEQIARAAGCCKLTLEVLEGNTVAQAVYRASGFAGYELDPQMGKAMFWQKKL